MNETAGPTEPGESLTQTLDKTIRIAVIVALAAWCFGVLAPFLVPMSWGIIIAVASHGFYEKLTGYLGGSRKLATTVYIVLGMALLLVPTIMLAETAVSSGRRLASEMEQGSFEIPPPPARVADWPLVGPKVSDLWSEASSSPPKMLSSLTPQLKVVGTWLLSSVASLGLVLIQFVISIIIAGVLLAHSEAGGRIANGLALRLAPRQGEELAVLARNTLRSVSRGIVGVAIIQAAMAGLGWRTPRGYRSRSLDSSIAPSSLSQSEAISSSQPAESNAVRTASRGFASCFAIIIRCWAGTATTFSPNSTPRRTCWSTYSLKRSWRPVAETSPSMRPTPRKP